MNQGTRNLLDRFTASDSYRGTVAMLQPQKDGAGILALDRWGRVLLQLRDADLPPERFPDQWSIPGGIIEPGEAPDAAAFREFEEETGILLQDLTLFRAYRKQPDLPTSLTDTYHIYFADPDLDEAEIEVREGQAFRYFSSSDITATANIPEPAPRRPRRILRQQPLPPPVPLAEEQIRGELRTPGRVHIRGAHVSKRGALRRPRRPLGPAQSRAIERSSPYPASHGRVDANPPATHLVRDGTTAVVRRRAALTDVRASERARRPCSGLGQIDMPPCLRGEVTLTPASSSSAPAPRTRSRTPHTSSARSRSRSPCR